MMLKGIKTVYLDFDGVIVDTVKAIVSLYNEDFCFYKKFKPVNWWEVNTWDFKECNCASSKYMNTYFNQPRLFERLEWMENAKEIIDKLTEVYRVKVVSHGYRPNLQLKEVWIKQNLPGIEFIGVNMKKHVDKACVDMKDGVFIDDNEKNLFTSNAFMKICFGDKYAWNSGWYGKRLYNWKDIERYLL